MTQHPTPGLDRGVAPAQYAPEDGVGSPGPEDSRQAADYSIDEQLSMLKPSVRAMLFIDGASTFQASRALGFDIDYKNLRAFFAGRCDLVRVYYFTLMQESNPNEPNSFNVLKPLVDWMNYNQYTVVQKYVRFINEPQRLRPQTKGTIDVELAVTAMQQLPHFDVAILFSGDGDFCALVEAIKAAGKRVIVVSALNTNPVLLSDDLRRTADVFVHMGDMQTQVARKTTSRRAKREGYARVGEIAEANKAGDQPDQSN